MYRDPIDKSDGRTAAGHLPHPHGEHVSLQQYAAAQVLSVQIEKIVAAGGSKPQEAAQDAASSVKAAIPDEPKQAAQDAVSSPKDSLPEPPSNPFQSFFSGKQAPLSIPPHIVGTRLTPVEACWHGRQSRELLQWAV